MNKKSPFFTASVASVVYFITFIILKYLLDEKLDMVAALIGAVIFWIVIFLVHHFLYNKLAG